MHDDSILKWLSTTRLATASKIVNTTNDPVGIPKLDYVERTEAVWLFETSIKQSLENSSARAGQQMKRIVPLWIERDVYSKARCQ